jgi:hypothetical protein
MAEISRKMGEAFFYLHSGTSTGSLPAPSTSSDGGAIDAKWLAGKSGLRDAALSIDCDGTQTISAGAELMGYDETDARWRSILVLNDGDAIALTSTNGWERKVYDVIGSFSRFAVKGTLSGGNVTIRMKPFYVESNNN